MPIAAQAEGQNFIVVEYAPFSKHLSKSDAPTGGYNEDNHIVIVKFGREHQLNAHWDYNWSAGYTVFKNSYDKTSHGPGVGAEALYRLPHNFKLYGGADLGLVSGYENNVDRDAVLFNRFIPFLTFNAGAEYDLGDNLPSIRSGIRYVPASLVGSDDVVTLSLGGRIHW